MMATWWRHLALAAALLAAALAGGGGPAAAAFTSTFTAAQYKQALDYSILFYEGQRSGVLPPTQRTTWRNNSALTDGQQVPAGDAPVDLVGGYYDAGDNIKFGFPMAFTVSLLGVSVLSYENELTAAGEIGHAREAMKWGADYFIKAHTAPLELWGQVGDSSDHNCWDRPEDMQTSRIAAKIDAQNPGTELAAETAAALAATSIVFSAVNITYSQICLSHAKQLFVFADQYRKTYDQSIGAASAFYHSYSGYGDELAWAAAWLFRATKNSSYLDYLANNEGTLGGTKFVTEFSWDDKHAGAQLLLAKVFLEEDFDTSRADYQVVLHAYKLAADSYVCANVPNTPNHQVPISPGGLVHIRDNVINLQYVTAASVIAAAYSDLLKTAGQSLLCASTPFDPQVAMDFAQSQLDYILGKNPNKMSYMVGFSSKFPQHIHHRGSSDISYNVDKTLITCNDGFNLYFNSPNPNPNVHLGAITGGPNGADYYEDVRSEYWYSEPADRKSVV